MNEQQTRQITRDAFAVTLHLRLARKYPAGPSIEQARAERAALYAEFKGAVRSVQKTTPENAANLPLDDFSK